MDSSHLLENAGQEASHGKGVERIREEGTVPLTALAQSLEYGRPSKTLAIGPFQYFLSWRPGKSSFPSVFDRLLLCWTSPWETSSRHSRHHLLLGPSARALLEWRVPVSITNRIYFQFLWFFPSPPILQTENLDSPCME